MACAAGMANLSDYTVKEYPEKKSIFEQIMNTYKRSIKANLIKEEIGAEQFRAFKELKKVKQMIGVPQTRLPFALEIH